MPTIVTAPKGSEEPPSTGRKNRFRRSSGKSSKNHQQQYEESTPREADNGNSRSLVEKRNQRTKNGLFRKLKIFGKSDAASTEQDPVMNESGSSPPNPLPPLSSDSIITLEVRTG